MQQTVRIIVFLVFVGVESLVVAEQATRILVTGGFDNRNKPLQSAELLTIPVTGSPKLKAIQLDRFNVTINGGFAAGFEGTRGRPDFLLVCGGEQKGSVSAECFIKEGSRPWAVGPKMVQGRADAAQFFKYDELYVSGGVDANRNLLASTEVFDANTRRWKIDESLTMPEGRSKHALVWNNEQFVVTGGKQGATETRDAFRFGPDGSPTFQSLPALPDARESHASFLETPTSDNVIVAGGRQDAQPVRKTFMFEAAKQQWKAGSNLPRNWENGCVVTDQHNRVFLIGGHPTDGRIIEYSEYKKSGRFILRSISLETPRRGCVAIEVPDGVKFPQEPNSAKRETTTFVLAIAVAGFHIASAVWAVV